MICSTWRQQSAGVFDSARGECGKDESPSVRIDRSVQLSVIPTRGHWCDREKSKYRRRPLLTRQDYRSTE